MKLRIAVLCPHFAPDTAPTGEVITRIVHELAALGHELHVVAALPWYREHRIEAGWDGKWVRREITPWGSITRVHPFPGSDKRNLLRRAFGFLGFSALAGLSSLRGGRVDAVIAMSPPLTDECTAEVEMIFCQQIVAIVDGNISYLCGYIGFSVVPSTYYNPATGLNEIEDHLLVLELNMGALTITRRRLSSPTVTINTDVVPVHQSCVPYHGYYNSFDEVGAELTNCFFGDNRIFFYRYTLEITE
jgi:hypothetical protein